MAAAKRRLGGGIEMAAKAVASATGVNGWRAAGGGAASAERKLSWHHRRKSKAAAK